MVWTAWHSEILQDVLSGIYHQFFFLGKFHSWGISLTIDRMKWRMWRCLWLPYIPAPSSSWWSDKCFYWFSPNSSFYSCLCHICWLCWTWYMCVVYYHFRCNLTYFFSLVPEQLMRPQHAIDCWMAPYNVWCSWCIWRAAWPGWFHFARFS
jgi:hypothetical protein